MKYKHAVAITGMDRHRAEQQQVRLIVKCICRDDERFVHERLHFFKDRYKVHLIDLI